MDYRQVSVELPPWAEAFEPPSRYKVAYGGRGSSKSWAFARKLLVRLLEEPTRALCCRELLNSIRESVHQLLVEQAEEIGVQQYFDIGEKHFRTVDRSSEVIYRGLRGNSQEIKSMEGIKICWVEEAQSVSEDSWKYLIPTIREEGSEIWITMNRSLITDPTDIRFVQNPPHNAIVRKVNWQDNPWFPEVLKEEMEHCKATDYDAYLHIWEGEPVLHTEAQVLHGKVVSEEFQPGLDWNGPYYGIDWGYSADPTAATRSWVYGRKLYVEYEVYGVGIDLDMLPGRLDQIPEIRRHVARADRSRPETIALLNKQGYNIQPAVQGPGSVDDGIAQLRGFEQIVVHPRCKHTLEESRLWQYKTDRLTGDVLPHLKPGWDHAWDSVRYAIEPLLGGRGLAKVQTHYAAPPQSEYAWMG